MIEVRNCKRCGRLFEVRGSIKMCTECLAQDEKDFSRIKEYLYLHPFAKIFEVSTNLDISINKIKRYLREGRIEIVEKDNQFLKCELCGRPICSGMYCDECSKKASNNIKSAYMGGDPLMYSNKVNYLSKNKTALKRTAVR